MFNLLFILFCYFQIFLRPLLSLAFAYGELHHFLSLYSLPYVELQPPKPTEQQKVLKEDESIYDMSFFHSYATRDQWVTLGQLGEEPDLLPIVTPFWGPLILQRIRHLVVFAGRNKQDKTVRKLVGWLVDRHDSGLEHLLVDNFKYLLAFIGTRQLETLGQKFITSEAWRKGPLQDPDLADKRSFQMTVNIKSKYSQKITYLKFLFRSFVLYSVQYTTRVGNGRSLMPERLYFLWVLKRS